MGQLPGRRALVVAGSPIRTQTREPRSRGTANRDMPKKRSAVPSAPPQNRVWIEYQAAWKRVNRAVGNALSINAFLEGHREAPQGLGSHRPSIATDSPVSVMTI